MTGSAGTADSKDKWNGGDDVGALVIDVGAHSTRAGYAGEDSPKQYWESIVGLPTSVTRENISAKHYTFPLNLYLKRDNLDVRPVLFQTGQDLGFDCDAFERVVQQCCSAEVGLSIDLKGKPVLLTEPNRHYRLFRTKMAELMFEQFQVEALYVAKKAVLSSFASGKWTALVVDAGALGTSITPVQDGYTLQRNMQEFPVGGNLLEDELAKLLADREYNVMPQFAVKVNVIDAKKGDAVPVDCSSVTRSYMEYGKRKVVRDLKCAICRVAEEYKPIEAAKRQSGNRPDIDPNARHELPDGTPIAFAEDIGMTIAEMMFQPRLMSTASRTADFNGIPAAISNCIQKCDPDLRKDLLGTIILTGGTSLMPGYSERVHKELQADERFSGTNKFKIVSHSAGLERQFSSWIGGSILASLGTFQQLWVSRVEYNEHGSDIVERKCMQ